MNNEQLNLNDYRKWLASRPIPANQLYDAKNSYARWLASSNRGILSDNDLYRANNLNTYNNLYNWLIGNN